jgi:hypothetical protein
MEDEAVSLKMTSRLVVSPGGLCTKKSAGRGGVTESDTMFSRQIQSDRVEHSAGLGFATLFTLFGVLRLVVTRSLPLPVLNLSTL